MIFGAHPAESSHATLLGGGVRCGLRGEPAIECFCRSRFSVLNRVCSVAEMRITDNDRKGVAFQRRWRTWVGIQVQMHRSARSLRSSCLRIPCILGCVAGAVAS